MTEFFDSLTIAQCRVIRSKVLATSEQIHAFNTAIDAAGTMNPKEASNEAGTPLTTVPPSPVHHATAETGAVMKKVWVHGTRRNLGQHKMSFQRCCCHMSTKATFDEFVKGMVAMFGVEPKVWHINWAMGSCMGWIDPRWHYTITKHNWEEVRDACLKSNAVLCLDLSV
jgi:hypothetical protein